MHVLGSFHIKIKEAKPHAIVAGRVPLLHVIKIASSNCPKQANSHLEWSFELN